MFEKLLSVLPSNPGVSNQLAFYARRMREEAAIRRIGMFFIVLAFMVQFFAVMSPPQNTSADSPNDLVNGGIKPANGKSAAQIAAENCNGGTPDYGAILNNYGISCADVRGASVVNLASNSHDDQLFSMGRIDYPNLRGEQPVTVGKHQYWVRHWSAWGVYNDDALKVQAADGTVYWILFGCGNLVSVGPPHQYTPPNPVIKINKSMTPSPGSAVKPGTTLKYQVDIDNTGNAPAHDLDLTDTVPDHTTFVSMSQNPGASSVAYKTGSQTADWKWPQMVAVGDGKSTTMQVKVNAGTPNGTQICNTATLATSDAGTKQSNKVCVHVDTSCTSNCTPPPSCENGQIDPDGPICHPTCENGGIAKSDARCTATCENGGLAPSSPECSCKNNISSDNPAACVVVHKTAIYGVTTGQDANNTTAQPGSVITYTLYAQNSGKSDVKSFVFNENLSDVLVYADVTDLHGGTMNSQNDVSWPAVKIPAGKTVTEQITVKVKNPVPSTPNDPADPGHFDLTMINVYGNTVTIKVPPTPITTVVNTTTQLPNTGPGESLFAIAVVMVVGGYFYSRARLLHEESVIAVQDAANA